MIYGIGTDIVAVVRLEEFYRRHGTRALEKLLTTAELGEFSALKGCDSGARFLAKRFAAKEAFGKALGTGIRAPVVLPAIGVGHDGLGKPRFDLTPEVARLLDEKGLSAHLSISDEREYAIAFVILEHKQR
ncbi:MAG TPA: holo-ACP synthase [Azospira sp.]|nr:holo-ACP synthase [Azospira sp.]